MVFKSKSKHGLAQLHQITALGEQLSKITHFTTEECKVLVSLHGRLESHGPLDRLRMREVLHVIFEITDDIMLDLAFRAFDKDEDNYVDDVEFVRGLSIMLRGTTEELSEWCYFIYDMNGDGGLAREELAHCLKGCIVPGYGIDIDEAEDGEKEIVEIAMRKLDVDKDGQITLTDFKKAVRRDPLLLVAVGPCLPPVRSCAAFLALITEKFRSYTGPLGRSPFPKTSNKFRFNSGLKNIQSSSSFISGTSKASTTLLLSSSAVKTGDTMEDNVKKAKTLSLSVVGTLPSKTMELLRRNTHFL